MKKIILTLAALLSVAAFGQTQPAWKLVWQEDFNGKTLDASRWSVIDRGSAHWNRYMSSQKDLVTFENGNVVLAGRVNTDKADTSRYVTGGIYTKDKYSFLYGRIEIRARLGSAQGAWPAFWLLPQSDNWPDGGEIDLMEHLNFDDFVYQTAHSSYTVELGIKDIPKQYGTAKIDRDGYNVYCFEWYPDRLVWLINGQPTFIYPKIETDKPGQFPFTEPFYILLDQQLGGPGTWVGEINEAQLPVKMWIDWVKVYQL